MCLFTKFLKIYAMKKELAQQKRRGMLVWPNLLYHSGKSEGPPQKQKLCKN